MMKILIVTAFQWIPGKRNKISGLDFQSLRLGIVRPKRFQELFCRFVVGSALTPRSFQFSLLYSLHQVSLAPMTPELGRQLRWVGGHCSVMDSGRARGVSCTECSPPLRLAEEDAVICGQNVQFFKRIWRSTFYGKFCGSLNIGNQITFLENDLQTKETVSIGLIQPGDHWRLVLLSHYLCESVYTESTLKHLNMPPNSHGSTFSLI